MSLRHLFVLSAALLLAACAPLKPAPPAEKRYTATELLALRPADLSWPAMSVDGERALREAAVADIRARIALPPGPERDAALPKLFDLVAQYNAEIDAARPLLLEALPTLGQRDADTQRALLTAAHTLYATDAEPLLWQLLPQLTQSKPFAIAVYTLLQARPGTAPTLASITWTQFPNWADDARLAALIWRLLVYADPPSPPLPDLLAAPLRPGYPVIFSLQRTDRQEMGLALVRGADGRFVRDASGQLFASPQLALARSGLPGTITNGNTPQGVFTIVGAGTATNPNIGPRPTCTASCPSRRRRPSSSTATRRPPRTGARPSTKASCRRPGAALRPSRKPGWPAARGATSCSCTARRSTRPITPARATSPARRSRAA